ncbi:hypothetical protein E2C01_016507 [Portunus trituberculatus]|uniref:Uncharacterized protein n=1 Tax=Portunus trituberculatus TaxID=210409 RepID=A0A5B7DPS4_PORTR|nr:hypothetical protein [Portunus trituberculatus]
MFRERSDVTGEPSGLPCGRQGTAKFVATLLPKVNFAKMRFAKLPLFTNIDITGGMKPLMQEFMAFRADTFTCQAFENLRLNSLYITKNGKS